jgi:predicted Zn-dependent protease
MTKKIYLVASLIIISAISVYFLNSENDKDVSKQALSFDDHMSNYNRFNASGHYQQAYKAICLALESRADDKDLLWQVSTSAQMVSNPGKSIFYAEKAWANGLHKREVILRIYSLKKSYAQSNLQTQEKLILMCAQLLDSEERVLTHGDLLMQFNKFDQAWDLWKREFEKNPSPKLAQRIGNCYIIQKDYQSAIDFLAQCYRNKILLEEGLLTYSRLFLIAGRYDAADIIFNEARVKYPNSKATLIESAYCKLLMIDYESALNLLNEADTWDLSDDDRLMINKRLMKANIYFIRRDFSAIAQLISQISSDDPKLEGEKLIYESASNPKSAIILPEEKIIRLLPKSALSRLLMVQYYHARNQNDKVMEISNGITDAVLKSSPLLTNLWTDSLIKENQHILAEQLIKRQFAKGLYTKSFFEQLRVIYTLNNKPDALIKLSELELKFFPEDKKLSQDLMFLYLNSKYYVKASNYFEQEYKQMINKHESVLFEALIKEDFQSCFEHLKTRDYDSKTEAEFNILIIKNIDLKSLSDEDRQYFIQKGAIGLQLAYRYLYSNEFDQASEIFYSLVDQDSLAYEAKIGLCITELNSGKLENAEQKYADLLEYDLASSNFDILKINFAIIKKQGAEALSLIEQLPFYFRSYKQVNLLTIKALMLEGEWGQAMTLFNYKNQSFCTTKREKMLLAECYLQLKQYSLAAEYIKENNLDQESSTLITYFLVREALKKGDIKKAKSIQASNQSKRSNLQYRLTEVAIELYEKNYGAVINATENEIEANSSAFFYWAQAHIHQGSFIEVQKVLARCAKQSSDVLRLAGLCESLGLYNEAIVLYKTQIASSDRIEEIHNNIAWNFYLDGQYEEALKESKKAHELAPFNNTILHSYSAILNANELYTETILTLRPNTQRILKHQAPKLLFNLAESYRKLDQDDEALLTYKACLESIDLGLGKMNKKSLQDVKTYISQYEGNY